MPICANCQRDAMYSYVVSGSYVLHYCQIHLPRFLTAQKNSGSLPLVTVAAVIEESVAPAAPIEEVPVTEASVEPAPVEEGVTPTEPEPSATVEEAPVADTPTKTKK